MTMVGVKLQVLLGNRPFLRAFAANVSWLAGSRQAHTAVCRGAHQRLDCKLPRIRAVRARGIRTQASRAVPCAVNAGVAHLRNEPRLVFIARYQKREFIHILRAYKCIINKPASFAAASDAIDVGSGEAVTIRDFVELTKHLAGAYTTLDFGAVPYRACEPMLCVADISRIQCLGWRPKYSLAEGLASTLNKLKS